jgi:DNA topoisomerase IB
MPFQLRCFYFNQEYSMENHTIFGSTDVNEYLLEISREEFTARDFRSWAGTVLASVMLREFEAFESEAQAKRNVVEAIKVVALRLGKEIRLRFAESAIYIRQCWSVI